MAGPVPPPPGSPVLRCRSPCAVPSSLPRRNLPRPVDSAEETWPSPFRRRVGFHDLGSRGLLDVHCALRPGHSLRGLHPPFGRRLPPVRRLPDGSGCFLAANRLPGRVSHPWDQHRLSRRTPERQAKGDFPSLGAQARTGCTCQPTMNRLLGRLASPSKGARESAVSGAVRCRPSSAKPTATSDPRNRHPNFSQIFLDLSFGSF